MSHRVLVEVVALRAFRDSRNVHIKPGRVGLLHPRAAAAAVTAGRGYYKKTQTPPENKGRGFRPVNAKAGPAQVRPVTKLKPVVPDPIPEDLTDITALKAPQARDLVANTESITLLEQFKLDELASKQRKSVLAAIESRLVQFTDEVAAGVD